MGDKSTHVPEPFYFHPCENPLGTESYDLSYLTKVQQKSLNSHKVEVIRENQKYLYKNPEIRGVLHVIMRKLLLERPSHDIEQFVSNYCSQHWPTITEEVDKYVTAIGGKPRLQKQARKKLASDKRVTLDEKESSEESYLMVSSDFSTEELDNNIMIIKNILEEVLNSVQEQLQKQAIPRTQVTVVDDIVAKIEKRDKEDELIFDLGLDYELDFSTYREEDDNINMQSFSNNSEV